MGVLRETAAAAPQRILLRAEVVSDRAPAVGHTRTVTVDTVVVELASKPSMGKSVTLRLSLPRLLDTIERTACVTAHLLGGDPGVPSGIELSLLHRSAEERADFADVLERLEKSAPRTGAHYRVLIVEDNAFIRDMFVYGVGRYFGGQHATVTVEVAENGEEAWKKLSAGPCDLAIVDHYLPVLDGSALIARIRREARLSGLPLVGMSGGGDEVREEMLGAGADLFLGKPVVLRDLFRTLERLASARAVA